MNGYKVFAHNLRSPIQGGEPVWDGTVPHQLPEVALDTSEAECAAGWNFCRDVSTALRISKFWPGGRAARVFEVTAADAIERGDKCRSAQLTIQRECEPHEIKAAIEELSREWFGDLAEEMLAEQWAWFQSLGSDVVDSEAVETGLRAALAHRGLDWILRSFSDAMDAWDSWAAWDAKDAWDSWDAWAAKAAKDAWDSWDAKDAWDARDAWDSWAAWAAWDARAARAALTVQYATRQGWVEHPPDLLTVGIRDAYAAGVELTLPTGPDELGYVIREES